MTDIGVIGGDETVRLINELYAMTEADVRVTPIHQSTPARRFNVLVINGCGHLAPGFLELLTGDDAVVLNADDKTLYSCLSGSLGRLITYGFSGKACVTASSVVDEAYECIQLCIQRSLPTLADGVLEPQEFSVSFDNVEKNIRCVLAAVTAALVAGLEVNRFLV